MRQGVSNDATQICDELSRHGKVLEGPFGLIFQYFAELLVGIDHGHIEKIGGANERVVSAAKAYTGAEEAQIFLGLQWLSIRELNARVLAEKAREGFSTLRDQKRLDEALALLEELP